MDRVRIETFLEAFTEHLAGATTIGLLAVADRSGLSRHLMEHPSGTSAEIAEAADLEERYVREILSGLAAAGIVEYDAGSKVFTMPAEHSLFLADETSPYFMGGWLDMIPAVMSQVEGVATATAHGGGVGFEEYGRTMIRGIDRGNAPSQTVFLTKRWLPAVPELAERLEKGARIADVGCGSGTAAILMAKAYPNCQVVGYDVSADSVTVARSRSEDIENVEFHNYSVEEIPTDHPFDLITTFDVIHDLPDPAEGLECIREALKPDGMFLMMEPEASSHLENNLTAAGALLYGISALHCMTQSLAKDGAGLGAAWGRELAEEYAAEAGFGSFQRLDDISNRFSAFYLLEP